MMNQKWNESLNFLRGKYGIPAGDIVSDGEAFCVRFSDGSTVKLLPWRVERRFVELKKIIDSHTLEEVSTLRFASFSAGGDLEKMLARELDLAVWLGGSPVKHLFATGASDAAYNVIVRLQNGWNVSIECGNKLPPGSDPIDRHEIIARRGVASDRVVDTQVPQSSIYSFTECGNKQFTDVDTELFGLSVDEIWIVRAAFAVLTHPEWSREWNSAWETGRVLCKKTVESDRTRNVIFFEENKK